MLKYIWNHFLFVQALHVLFPYFPISFSFAENTHQFHPKHAILVQIAEILMIIIQFSFFNGCHLENQDGCHLENQDGCLNKTHIIDTVDWNISINKLSDLRT